MGYTQYFPQQRDFTNDEWNTILTFAKSLFKDQKLVLANGMGDLDSKPVANKSQISFNGIGDESHETFYLTKKRTPDFNFTKTAQKEYDSSVVAMLTYIHHIAPDALSISSDGDTMMDFEKGIALAKKISGITNLSCPVKLRAKENH